MYIINVKEYIIVRIAIYKMKRSQASLRISCTKLYYEFPVQRGKKYMLHTKVGNKGWKAEKRTDWQKKSSKPSEELTTFSLHVNDGKRLVTRGTCGDPERKRIMTPAYLRNRRPVHPFGMRRGDQSHARCNSAVDAESARKRCESRDESHGCNREVLNYP